MIGLNLPTEQVPSKIKNKEKWTPKETRHTVSAFIDLVENDINALMKQSTKKLKFNLTYKEHAAMEELAKRKDLIITNADKGGAVVIMDTDSYAKEPIGNYLTKPATNNQLKTQHYNITEWSIKE